MRPMNNAPYTRVLLKITGEALSCQTEHSPFSTYAMERLVEQIKQVHEHTTLAIVVGGGNIIRGSKLIREFGIDATNADFIGMTATITNALLLEACLTAAGVCARVASSIPVHTVAEPYIFKRARRHLDHGEVLILAGGTGNSGFTTDTGAVVRASDLKMDIVMKGTKVAGVFTADPKKHTDATLIPLMSYQDFLERRLSGILDKTAVTQAEEKNMPILVFDIFEPGSLLRAISGESIGSLITSPLTGV